MKKKTNLATHSQATAKKYLFITALMLFTASTIPSVLIFDLRQHHESGMQNYIAAGVLGLFLVITAASLLWRGIQNYLVVQKLEKEGIQLKAKITRKWIDTFRGEDFFRVSYCIREDIEVWETVTAEFFKKLETERDVLIRALESKPEIARLEGMKSKYT